MNLFQLRKTAEARSGQSLSMAVVAKGIGVSRQQYWLYEKGKTIPNFTIVRPLTAFFRQWLPELTADEVLAILDETTNSHAPAA